MPELTRVARFYLTFLRHLDGRSGRCTSLKLCLVDLSLRLQREMRGLDRATRRDVYHAIRCEFENDAEAVEWQARWMMWLTAGLWSGALVGAIVGSYAFLSGWPLPVQPGPVAHVIRAIGVAVGSVVIGLLLGGIPVAIASRVSGRRRQAMHEHWRDRLVALVDEAKARMSTTPP